MTVEDLPRRSGPFAGTGTIIPYPFSFRVDRAEDVLVVVQAPDDSERTALLNTDYSVFLNSNQTTIPGGTVTLVNPLLTGYSLTIGSQAPYEQPMALQNLQGMYPTTLNDNSDLQCIQIQQLAEELARALVMPMNSDLTWAEILALLYAAQGWAQTAMDAAALVAPSVGTVQDLRDLTLGPALVWVRGAVTAGDGGHGPWYWDAASTATDNLGAYALPTGHVGVGRWRRLFSGPVHVAWFGAAGSSTGDDTTAIQAAIDFAYAARIGTVQLGPAHRVQTLNLRSGVVLEGLETSGTMDGPWTPGLKAAHYSVLYYIGDNLAACVQHLSEYVSDVEDDRARAFGLRRVTVIHSAGTTTGTGILFAHAAHIIMDDVRTQEFDQAVVISDIYDSTFTNVRTGGGNYGITITNSGTLNNTNNVVFIHARTEGWKRCGVRVLSPGGPPNLNNKVTFIHLKNEGSPDGTSIAGLLLDGVQKAQFYGGQTTIKPVSGVEAPPSTFTLCDIRDTNVATGRVVLDWHELSTNGGANIDSLLRIATTNNAVNGLDMRLNLTSRNATDSFVNGFINVLAGVVASEVFINLVRVQLGDSSHAVWGGAGYTPLRASGLILWEGRPLGMLRISASETETPEVRLETFDPGETGNYWAIKRTTGNDLSIQRNGSEILRFEDGGRVFLQGSGAGIRLESPNGLVSRTISLNNAGELIGADNLTAS